MRAVDHTVVRRTASAPASVTDPRTTDLPFCRGTISRASNAAQRPLPATRHAVQDHPLPAVELDARQRRHAAPRRPGPARRVRDVAPPAAPETRAASYAAHPADPPRPPAPGGPGASPSAPARAPRCPDPAHRPPRGGAPAARAPPARQHGPPASSSGGKPHAAPADPALLDRDGGPGGIAADAKRVVTALVAAVAPRPQAVRIGHTHDVNGVHVTRVHGARGKLTVASMAWQRRVTRSHPP